MNWQLFPVILLKALFLAAVCVGTVGGILAGFFIGIGYVDDKFGANWAFFAFATGVVFVIVTIALVCWEVDEAAKR